VIPLGPSVSAGGSPGIAQDPGRAVLDRDLLPCEDPRHQTTDSDTESCPGPCVAGLQHPEPDFAALSASVDIKVPGPPVARLPVTRLIQNRERPFGPFRAGRRAGALLELPSGGRKYFSLPGRCAVLGDHRDFRRERADHPHRVAVCCSFVATICTERHVDAFPDAIHPHRRVEVGSAGLARTAPRALDRGERRLARPFREPAHNQMSSKYGPSLPATGTRTDVEARCNRSEAVPEDGGCREGVL